MKKKTKLLCMVMAILLGASVFVACAAEPAASESPSQAASESASAEASAPAESAEASQASSGGDDINPAEYPVAVAMMLKNHPVHRMVKLLSLIHILYEIRYNRK